MKKRRRRNSRGGGRRSGQGKGKESERGNNSNKTSKKKNPPPPPTPPVLGTVATRTRRQQRDIVTKWKEPLSILINIMGYADPDTIRTLCCVSTQFRDIINNDPGMEQNRAVPLLQIRPAKEQDDKGRIERLLRLLHCHRDQIQRYRTIKVIDVHKFDGVISHFEWGKLDKITDTFRLYGIVSLDMSSPPPFIDLGDNDLAFYFPSILPNLRDVNLSDNRFDPSCLKKFSKKCPNLEKITWHKNEWVDLIGLVMKDAANVKEIYMDNSTFVGAFSDLEDDDDEVFLFYKCSSKLERVSIRNATFYDYEFYGEKTVVVPQTALIKFVRNVPSLKWFRSNLSHKNMDMLRSERPGIEFLN